MLRWHVLCGWLLSRDKLSCRVVFIECGCDITSCVQGLRIWEVLCCWIIERDTMSCWHVLWLCGSDITQHMLGMLGWKVLRFRLC